MAETAATLTLMVVEAAVVTVQVVMAVQAHTNLASLLATAVLPQAAAADTPLALVLQAAVLAVKASASFSTTLTVPSANKEVH